MPKRKQPPMNATAWCEYHGRLMNDKYVDAKNCVMRGCKHLRWLWELNDKQAERKE